MIFGLCGGRGLHQPSPHQTDHPRGVSTKRSSSALRKELISAVARRSADSARAVVQLPMRSQMTLGGLPRRMLSSEKSESFVTITKPCSRAKSHTRCLPRLAGRKTQRGRIRDRDRPVAGPEAVRDSRRAGASSEKDLVFAIGNIRIISKCAGMSETVKEIIRQPGNSAPLPCIPLQRPIRSKKSLTGNKH